MANKTTAKACEKPRLTTRAKALWLAAGLSPVIQTGRSPLALENEAGWQSKYHVAFDVPENQLAAAREWLEQRVTLIERNGEVVFHFQNWNAHSLYFCDPAGNILELIARHNQPNTSYQPFSPFNILHISEIGLPTLDVVTTVNLLGRKLGITTYDGAGSEAFSAVGDETGLFIVVRQGRIWYPETGIPADLSPVRVTILGKQATTLVLPSLPYHIQVVNS
jgi:catechol-2,3-dioxygenase